MRRSVFLMSSGFLTGSAAFSLPPPLLAGDATAAKDRGGILSGGVMDGGYTLFRPVPKDKLREFDTDRPDQATGPRTVDAGHVYLEMDLANYTLDRHNPERTPMDVDQWNVAPVSVRVGLLPNVELDLQHEGYVNLRTRDRAARKTQTESGAGDFSLRSKINLAGNDGGKAAFGIFPSLRLPTSTADLASQAVEGGMGLAFSAKLPGDFSLTASADFQFIRNSTDSFYVVDYLDDVSISHELGSKSLSAFVEFASEVSSESPSPAACQVDAGFIYQISDNVQLDLDCYFGVTRNAPDFLPFAGLAVRW